ncbi:exported hypothetical protein [uncultured Desulfobacterium sp.]|uniref:Cupin type-2 domain-containing protein n=1 Tax=uncultured Desulfobacterium sp. TaxID=201089 RepID=A0A445MV37_9BACT|nr:exported hypothetical protein [uncultured Desulfobacterium sp.]
MKRLILVFLLAFSAIACPAFSRGICPEPVLPETLKWVSPPGMPGVQGAWVLGSEQKPGTYLFRARLASGAKIPPHTHPDERNTTVLTGIIYVGFGEKFDETKMVAVPAGGVYIAPANVTHYIWARDGDASYQEAGTAPTGTFFIRP